MDDHYKRAQEFMRRLNLPPDPKLKQKVDDAFAARNSCFENAMRPLVRKGLRGKDLAEAACHACSKQVVAAATVFFEANKDRYMDSSLEKQIKEDQDNCSLYAFSVALEMPDRMAEEPDQAAVVARHGDWVVTEVLNFERRIAFRAVLQDQSDKSRYIEWKTPGFVFGCSTRPSQTPNHKIFSSLSIARGEDT